MGDDFYKKSRIKKELFLVYFLNIFLCCYCSIDLKRQSEQSWICHDMSSPVDLNILYSEQFLSFFIRPCSGGGKKTNKFD